MLQASLTFFVLALLSMIFGAYNVAGLSMEVGRLLLIAFLILAVISFIISLATGKKPNRIP